MAEDTLVIRRAARKKSADAYRKMRREGNGKIARFVWRTTKQAQDEALKHLERFIIHGEPLHTNGRHLLRGTKSSSPQDGRIPHLQRFMVQVTSNAP